MRYTFMLTGLFLLVSLHTFPATRYWKGTVNGSWNQANNWYPSGTPNNGDDLIFDQSGLNTTITNVPSIRLNSLKLQTTGTPIAYSFSGSQNKVLSFSGPGNCFQIGENSSLTLSSSPDISMGEWGTQNNMYINGHLTVNSDIEFTWGAGQLFVDEDGTFTMNGNLTYNSENSTMLIKGTAYIATPLTFPYSDSQLIVDTTGELTIHGAFTYNASGNITVRGEMKMDNTFTVGFSDAQITIESIGKMEVTGAFLYQSDGNINVNGEMVINAFTVPYTDSQIIVGNAGKMVVDGPMSYNSSADFVVNGEGTFHINNTYDSGNPHQVTGSGKAMVDANKTMTIHNNLTIEHDLEVHGKLVVPAGKTIHVNGNIRVHPN